jgi:hypothetical protein
MSGYPECPVRFNHLKHDIHSNNVQKFIKYTAVPSKRSQIMLLKEITVHSQDHTKP